jgi:hypothetical protein
MDENDKEHDQDGDELSYIVSGMTPSLRIRTEATLAGVYSGAKIHNWHSELSKMKL